MTIRAWSGSIWHPSAHTVRVLGAAGKAIAKGGGWPTAASLSEVEETAFAGAQMTSGSRVVMDKGGMAPDRSVLPRPRPRGAPSVLGRGGRPAPVPVPTYQDQRHRRQHLGPGAAGLQPLRLPDAEQTALDRRVRATDRLTRVAAEHSGGSSTPSGSCCRSPR